MIALSRRELDVTDVAAVRSTMHTYQPDIVVNAAAFTDVDAADAQPDVAHAINAVAPGELAAASIAEGARFLQLSTDYVFSGRDAGGRPYDEGDPTDPINVYGRSKRDGELAVLAAAPNAYVVRTSWVYGAHGDNFVRTIRRLLTLHPTINVVDDQEGSPTWSRDLCRGLMELVDTDSPGGIYHVTNAGHTSRFGQARAIASLLGSGPGAHPACRDQRRTQPRDPTLLVGARQPALDSRGAPAIAVVEHRARRGPPGPADDRVAGAPRTPRGMRPGRTPPTG